MKKTLCRALSVVALMAMLAGCAPKETAAPTPAPVTTPAPSDEPAGAYTDGVYHAVGTGLNGDVNVTVTVENGMISKVEIGENKETEGIGTLAIDTLPQKIIDAQSVDVDVVSGATITSQAILEAVKKALSGETNDQAAEVVLPFEKPDVIVVGARHCRALRQCQGRRAGRQCAGA